MQDSSFKGKAATAHPGRGRSVGLALVVVVVVRRALSGFSITHAGGAPAAATHP